MGCKIQYYPLTYPQKGIWNMEKFHPGTSIGNIAGTLKINENIDYMVFEKAINVFLEKNDGIRIKITEINSEPMQYIEKYEYKAIEVIDFRDKDLDEIYRWDEHQTRQPFNLLDNELFKFFTIKISDTEGGFYVKVNHLIGDAWSLTLIGNEIVKYYHLLKNNIEIPSEKRPSYIEYIESEANYLKSDRFIKNKSYWMERYSTIPEFTTLKNTNQSYISTKARRKNFVLSKSVTVKIREMCRELKISPFNFFMAILSIYLNKATEKEDITIGTPILNRANIREKSIIGMFISVSPLRTTVDKNSTFREHIKIISAEINNLLKNQKYPYDILLKEVRENLKIKDNLYDIVLSYQNAKFDKETYVNNYTTKWHFNGHETSALTVHISDREDNDTLSINIDYLIDVFTHEDVDDIYKRMTKLAIDTISNPDKKIYELEFLSTKEINKLLYRFNQTSEVFDCIRTIHGLFEEQVKISPNATAVVFEDEKISYDELNRRANKLARAIMKSVHIDSEKIGIVVNRSIDMIVGLLAILKSGNAYVPIDPEYPQERISYILNDSAVSILLTQSHLKHKFTDKQVIIIDDKEIYQNGINEENIILSQKPNLAYVIYTSGTTGNPKGVLIKHYSITNTLLWRKKYYNFDEQFRVLQLPSFAFDSSIEDIFTPLISGSSLIMLNQKGNQFDLNYIQDVVIKNEVNHFLIVPSFYKLFLEQIPEYLQKFKSITIAGEGFTNNLVEKHFERLPNVRFCNEYGPTENSVCSTVYEFTKENTNVLIGKPISNCKCYVLNSNKKLCPIGIEGELYLGGEGLSMGYLNRKELTIEKFIENPFVENSYIYKTGDIVRWNKDGFLEFLGRVDDQIKINGYRVELKEIQNVILKHLKIKDVAIDTIEDENSKKHICAYLVATEKINISELKRFISTQVPYYMIPTIYIEVEKIPLTPNGKLNKGALPKPVSTSEFQITPPTNEIEENMLQIWKQVFEKTNIGIEHDFFDIGGDSLIILSIQAKLFKYNYKITVQDYFEYPTIKLLAQKAQKHSTKKKAEKDELAQRKYVDDVNSIVISKDKSPSFTNVLLTGVTGFLGSHILEQLLMNKNTKIYCLVRQKDKKLELQKLIESLHYYFGDKYDQHIGKRIMLVQGDLSKKKFGLEKKEYELLIKKIDTVVNCAALVSHYGKYSEFKRNNVDSVNHIIEFCKETKAVLNHISTTNVSGNYLLSEHDTEHIYIENDFYVGQAYKENVYVRSKFEAENLIFLAINAGVKANIYRVGNLTGRYSDGKFQKNSEKNAFYNRILAISRLKKIPESLENQEIELTPVDECSKVIVELMKHESVYNKVFHLFNDNAITIGYLVDIFNTYGLNISRTTDKSFLEYIKEDEITNITSKLIYDFDYKDNLDYTTSIIVDNEITKKYMELLDLHWSKIDENYFKKIFSDILGGGL